MKFKLNSKQLNIVFSISAVLFLILVWVIVYYSVKNDYIVPSLKDTAVSFFSCFTEKNFWISFGFTLLRTIIAVAVSFTLAAAFAVLSVLCKPVQYFLNPVIGIIRTLPTLAVMLILLVWTTPNVAPVTVAVLVLFPLTYSQLSAAADGVGGDVLQMCAVYNVGRRDKIFKIFLPLVLPEVVAQTGANFSLGLKVTVSAEVLAHTFKSLGTLMQNAQLYVDMPRLAALTLFAVLCGLGVECAFRFLKPCFKWKRR